MRAALVYDFDGTLARGNMQDVALLPQLGIKTPAQIAKFWAEVVKQNTADDGDHTLAYLRHLVEAGRALGNPITCKMLNACGKKLSYFDGVPDWFDRIDAFGSTSHGFLAMRCIRASIAVQTSKPRLYGASFPKFSTR